MAETPAIHASISSTGGRAYNEDRCWSLITEQAACFAVADGLGGHGGGDRAAELTIQAIAEQFERAPGASTELLQEMLTQAESYIASVQGDGAEWRNMRSTAVVMVTDYYRVHWAHIGDSRLYQFRQGTLAEQTLDHSVPQELAMRGDISMRDIRRHPDRNRLLRSLGSGGTLKPEIHTEPVKWQAGDAYLLCTDGFWENLTEEEIEVELAKSTDASDWLRHMLDRLRMVADPENDNYTAIAVHAGALG
jgi:serine/threonine protein phosphatase PrpC